MRFHVVSLPHTQTTSQFVSCAYTQKVVKFARMMMARGHEVVLYSGEENDAPCTEHVVIVKKHEQRKWFGPLDLDAMYPITWSPQDEHWQTTNKRVIRHIKSGMKAGKYDQRDMVCVIAGTCNEQIALALPNITPEYGVGYTGIFTHSAFESVSHRHHTYTLRGIGDGRFYDAVIPNYFDPTEFAPQTKKEDHLLFVGRIILRKGVHIAAQVAEATGRKLLVAGQGVIDHGPGYFESDEIKIQSDHVEFIGTLDLKQRAYEMARARAVLVPTTYLEPFGGVAVEAMLSGTPAITTDWGAFTETNISGVTGFRPNILREWVDAIENGVETLDPETIRKSAEERYALDAVAPQFETWFARLETLWDEGWHAP